MLVNNIFVFLGDFMILLQYKHSFLIHDFFQDRFRMSINHRFCLSTFSQRTAQRTTYTVRKNAKKITFRDTVPCNRGCTLKSIHLCLIYF